jgi:isocitrate dehydrogenase kinase/phosphatase
MVVFTLPSFPYVFKLIRDTPRPPKDVTPAQVKDRYRMVKKADRAGRMADTLEYSDVALPKSRLSPELLDELRREVPAQLTDEGDALVFKHVYIERRMKPLDLALRAATDAELIHLVDDFGHCMKELASANLFAGDLLYKNFGVTRLGRVIFYDYDEVETVTQVNFRVMPKARDDEEELRGEAWFQVGPHDVFPEEWRPFLFTDERVRAVLEERHPQLFDAGWWNDVKKSLESGRPVRVSPYPDAVRFSRR